MSKCSWLLSASALIAVAMILLLECGGIVEGSSGERGELSPLPPIWNQAPPSRMTNRHKGDIGDIDPRGSVRYNIGLDGKIMKGIITKHREVPVDDNGTGLFQATEECCHHQKYNDTREM